MWTLDGAKLYRSTSTDEGSVVLGVLEGFVFYVAASGLVRICHPISGTVERQLENPARHLTLVNSVSLPKRGKVLMVSSEGFVFQVRSFVWTFLLLFTSGAVKFVPINKLCEQFSVLLFLILWFACVEAPDLCLPVQISTTSQSVAMFPLVPSLLSATEDEKILLAGTNHSSLSNKQHRTITANQMIQLDLNLLNLKAPTITLVYDVCRQ